MMKLYLIFTKKGLAVILALTVIALILLGQFSTVNQGYYDGSTHQCRMDYLRLAGIKVNETPIAIKETSIPDEFSGHIAEYNKILQKAGFDLSNFRGKEVTVYTYIFADFPQKSVNVMVCDGKIISGDVTDNLNQITSPLTKEK